MCLGALGAEGSPWLKAFEHRFRGGDLDGHALGNLMIVGLAEVLGDFGAALAEAGRILGAAGVVMPATVDSVVLRALIDGEFVDGQVAVATASGHIDRIELLTAEPLAPSPVAYAPAVEAIRGADQIVLAPGSLYTSLLPVLCVGGIGAAVREAKGRVVQVANLRPQIPETEGLCGSDHLSAVQAHGGRADVFLYQRDGELPVDSAAIRALGSQPMKRDLAGTEGGSHDLAKLARALKHLL